MLNKDRYQFRAWLPISRKMVNLNRITVFAVDPIVYDIAGGVYIPFKERDGEDSIIMQSTGERDKDGQLAFESDEIIFDGQDDSRKYVITYEKGCFFAKCKVNDYATSTRSLVGSAPFKIVGNIYG